MLIKITKQVDLTGFSLIVPAVAVGNVAQLAVDLLIYNGDMRKIGQATSPDFIPFLGADPYDENSQDICTTADLYIHEGKKIIALQIRSPPVNKLEHFFDKLRHFVEDRRISKVIVLTSQWQFVRVDAQLRTEPMRYIASSSIDLEIGKIFKRLEWKKLEETLDPVSNENRLEISGGGFASSLFKFLSDREIPSVVLLKFSSEGNNSPDAKELASFFNQWISLVSKNSKDGNINWEEPPSWRHIFGHEAPREIY